ncbi:MAG: LLM class F420-dependent oxidoreductase [Acidimicrobiia bacterium]
MSYSVVLPIGSTVSWEQLLEVARRADELGFPELWIGELDGFDAFTLAGALGRETSRVEMTLGPLAVSVRSPVGLAMGAASVAAVSSRRANLAIGTSSNVVVENWHGRSRRRPAAALDDAAIIIRSVLDGAKTDYPGGTLGSRGFRLRLPHVAASLTIAAFGQRALQVAARRADRVVLNMMTVDGVRRVRAALDEEAGRIGRDRVRLAVWLATAVDPTDEVMEQQRRTKVGYLAAPGYAAMFEEAGFGELVDFARTRPHPRELHGRVPDELVHAVGLLGTAKHVLGRADDYFAAGVDEICLVPSIVNDPGGSRVLETLAPERGGLSDAPLSSRACEGPFSSS